MIALVGDILRNASFPAADLEELRQQTLSSIEAQRKEPDALVGTALARHGDPYPRGDVRHARSFDERVEDAKAVTIDQVRAFHTRFYGASHAQFSASGEMDDSAVKTALDKAFGDWKSTAPYARVPKPLVAVSAEPSYAPATWRSTGGSDLRLVARPPISSIVNASWGASAVPWRSTVAARRPWRSVGRTKEGKVETSRSGTSR